MYNGDDNYGYITKRLDETKCKWPADNSLHGEEAFLRI